MGGRGSSGGSANGGVAYSANGRTISKNQLSQAQKEGASLWQKYGKNRLYIEDYVPKLLGIKVERYKTGNIKYAEMGGETISNNLAEKYLWAAKGAYIDLNNMTINMHPGKQADAIADAIKKKFKWRR